MGVDHCDAGDGRVCSDSQTSCLRSRSPSRGDRDAEKRPSPGAAAAAAAPGPPLQLSEAEKKRQRLEAWKLKQVEKAAAAAGSTGVSNGSNIANGQAAPAAAPAAIEESSGKVAWCVRGGSGKERQALRQLLAQSIAAFPSSFASPPPYTAVAHRPLPSFSMRAYAHNAPARTHTPKHTIHRAPWDEPELAGSVGGDAAGGQQAAGSGKVAWWVACLGCGPRGQGVIRVECTCQHACGIYLGVAPLFPLRLA